MQKFIVVSLAALFITSCGQLNTDGSSTGGGAGGSVNAGRAVIKDGSGNTVAHLVQFSAPRVVLLYLVSSNKYAFIDMTTGEYTSSRSPANTITFWFSGASCSGNAAVDDDWMGPIGTIFFVSNRYLEVTSTAVSGFPYVSSLSSGQFFSPEDCLSSSGTTAGAFVLTEVSRPYDFEAIAPLTITYE